MKTNSLLTNVCALAATMLVALPLQKAQASLGTAVGNDVTLYTQGSDYKANLESQSANTLSYRIVEADGSLFALISTSDAITGDAWAAQVRDWGVSGDTKYEMNITERNGDQTAYNLKAVDFPEDGGTIRQMQVFVNFANGGFTVTDLFQFEKGKINTSVPSSAAPVLNGEVSYSLDGTQCTLSLPEVGENVECFYLVSDAVAGISQVYFFAGEQTLELSPATAYNLKVEAIDYAGNRSTSQTLSFSTDFDTSVNLALGRPTSASSGSSALAVDGDEGSRWESASADDEWWEVELSNAFNLDYIEIKWEAAYSKHFYIQTKLNESDEWTSKDVTYDGSNSLLQTISMVGTAARYIRFQGVERATGWGNSFYEFRVYATSVYSGSVSDDLTAVQVTPRSGNIFCGETFSFTALALSGAGAMIEDAVFTVVIPENCTVTEKGNGAYEFTSDVAGEYVVTVSAESNGIEKNATLTVKVSEVPVLTTLTLKEALTTVGVVGRRIELIVTALDQYGMAFACTPDFIVTGSAGGEMENNYYVASSVGSDKVRAVVGSIGSDELTINIVAQGENLALLKEVSANEGATDIANAVDGDYGSLAILHENTADDEASRTYPVQLTVDLNPVAPILSYNIALVEVDWEGATAADYTVDYSFDGETWESVYGMTDGAGMVSRHDAFYPAITTYASTEQSGVRFVRLNITKAATQYGVKVREISVYGTANYPTSVESMKDYGTRVWKSGTSLNATADVCCMEVYNAAGSKVVSSKGNTVDISALARGVYIVRMTVLTGQVVTAKIVK